MSAKRKQHSADFKARVAMAALTGEKTLTELSSKFGVHPTMISTWKQELMKRASELFARGNKAPTAEDAQKVIGTEAAPEPVNPKAKRPKVIPACTYHATTKDGAKISATATFRWGKTNEDTQRAFEDARMKFDVRYYLVAILFILFDLEIAFLFPWAVSLREIGPTGFWAMMVFLAILVVGDPDLDAGRRPSGRAQAAGVGPCGSVITRRQKRRDRRQLGHAVGLNEAAARQALDRAPQHRFRLGQ